MGIWRAPLRDCLTRSRDSYETLRTRKHKQGLNFNYFLFGGYNISMLGQPHLAPPPSLSSNVIIIIHATGKCIRANLHIRPVISYGRSPCIVGVLFLTSRSHPFHRQTHPLHSTILLFQFFYTFFCLVAICYARSVKYNPLFRRLVFEVVAKHESRLMKIRRNHVPRISSEPNSISFAPDRRLFLQDTFTPFQTQELKTFSQQSISLQSWIFLFFITETHIFVVV